MYIVRYFVRLGPLRHGSIRLATAALRHLVEHKYTPHAV